MTKATKRSLRIVYLVAANLDDITGGLRVIFEHVNRLASRGYHVEIWNMGEGTTPYFVTNVEVMPYEEAKLSDPDIIVMTDPGFVPMVSTHRKNGGTFLLLQHDIEWLSEVTTYHGYGGIFRESKNYFESGDCEILVVSTWLREILQEKYGLDSHIVMNGIDSELFHPDKPMVQVDDPIVLLPYDPQNWKGFNEAIQATLYAREKMPNLQIALLGRYLPQAPNVEGVSYGLAFPAIYFNRPEQRHMAKIYSSASVFVTASWKEGFGLPGLEAMACGVPVVTTDSGGNRDFAIDGDTAIVVPDKDMAALVDGILRLLSDTQLHKKFSRNGLRKAKEFNWDTSIDQLEHLLLTAARDLQK